MVERLTITTMGKQKLSDKLKDRVLAALNNQSRDCSDEQRAVFVVDAVLAAGDYAYFPDTDSSH